MNLETVVRCAVWEYFKWYLFIRFVLKRVNGLLLNLVLGGVCTEICQETFTLYEAKM